MKFLASVLSPTIEVLTPEMPAKEAIMNGNNRKSLIDENSATGNDSEGDSGKSLIRPEICHGITVA